MAKFTLSAEFTDDQILDFAKANGWKEETEISAEEYTKSLIKKKIVWVVGSVTRDKINKDFQEQKKQALNQLNEELEQAISLQ